MKAKLLLVLGSLLFTLGVGEVLVRLAGYGNALHYEPDDVVLFRPRPNQVARSRAFHREIRINSLGLRGPEFVATKPPGVFRILTIGDSFNFGWEMAEADTYPARLEHYLQKHMAQVEVLNGGVIAYSLSQAVAFLRAYGVNYEPDLVVVSYCWNEGRGVHPNSPPEARARVQRMVRLKDLLRRSALYLFVVELSARKVFYKRVKNHLLVENQDKTKAAVSELAAYRAVLHDVFQLAQEQKFRLVGLRTSTRRNIADGSSTPYQEEFSRVLAAKDQPLIETTALFAGYETAELFLPDGHPNETYYDLEAAHVSRFLVENGLVPLVR